MRGKKWSPQEPGPTLAPAPWPLASSHFSGPLLSMGMLPGGGAGAEPTLDMATNPLPCHELVIK